MPLKFSQFVFGPRWLSLGESLLGFVECWIHERREGKFPHGGLDNLFVGIDLYVKVGIVQIRGRLLGSSRPSMAVIDAAEMKIPRSERPAHSLVG